MSFDLDPRIESSTFPAGDLMLCRLCLMNDARFPWIILIPRRARLLEFLDLSPTERAIVMEEMTCVSRALKDHTKAEKMNVAAIGNIVPQLHIHVVARFASDAAWPGPVWGHGKAEAYAPGAAEALLAGFSAKMWTG